MEFDEDEQLITGYEASQRELRQQIDKLSALQTENDKLRAENSQLQTILCKYRTLLKATVSRPAPAALPAPAVPAPSRILPALAPAVVAPQVVLPPAPSAPAQPEVGFKRRAEDFIVPALPAAAPAPSPAARPATPADPTKVRRLANMESSIRIKFPTEDDAAYREGPVGRVIWNAIIQCFENDANATLVTEDHIRAAGGRNAMDPASNELFLTRPMITRYFEFPFAIKPEDKTMMVREVITADTRYWVVFLPDWLKQEWESRYFK